VAAVAAVDAATLETLARLQLAAHRRGATLELLHACDHLRELLRAFGLEEVLPYAEGEQRPDPA
jgi:ABC-type transporter Mla MlaB component